MKKLTSLSLILLLMTAVTIISAVPRKRSTEIKAAKIATAKQNIASAEAALKASQTNLESARKDVTKKIVDAQTEAKYKVEHDPDTLRYLQRASDRVGNTQRALDKANTELYTLTK